MGPISSTSWLVTCVLSGTRELFTVLHNRIKTQGDRLVARGDLPGDVNKIYAALSGHKTVQDTSRTNLLQGPTVPSQESDFKSFFSVSTRVSGNLKEKISLYIRRAAWYTHSHGPTRRQRKHPPTEHKVNHTRTHARTMSTKLNHTFKRPGELTLLFHGRVLLNT